VSNFQPLPNNFNDPPSIDAGEDEDLPANQEHAEIELIESSKIPWLQEIFFTGTKIFILVLTLIVITLSIVAKVTWWVIILRAGVTILVIGFLAYLLNWILGRYLVDAKLAELKEKNAVDEAAQAERLAREQAEMDAIAMLQEQENEGSRLEIER